jgi:hypothetical protein
LAVFERAIVKLQAVGKMKLIAAPGLATLLNDLRASIVEPDPDHRGGELLNPWLPRAAGGAG